MADNILLSHVWDNAANLVPGKPYRGQVALAIALESALFVPAASVTKGEAIQWYARGEDLIAQLEQHLSQPPVNLIGALPDIDLSEPFQKHLGSPLKILKCRYGDARFQHTLNGAQTCSAVRYFVRSMALFWRGMQLTDGHRLTAAMVRVHFGKGGYTAAHARRDTEAQPLPGRLRPWGWNLDEKSWISALKERIAEQPYRNSPNTKQFFGYM